MGSFLTNKIKANCSGCEACSNICPKNCITMKNDEEGFKYPNVDLEKCIKCNMCLKVCSYENKNNIILDEERDVYAVKNKHKDIHMNSSSGGVFTAISNYIIEQDGIIVGAKFSDEFSVEHSIASTKEERDMFRGSKYIQSNIKGKYKLIKKELLGGRKVLFVGNPCQVDGLNRYLGKKYGNLITLDFVCHGVPNYEIFRAHINNILKDYNASIEDIKQILFRDKSIEGSTKSLRIDFKDGRTYLKNEVNDEYYKLFSSNVILRPSCYNCLYCNTNRVSDITIGDFWGIEEVRPEFDDKLGVSLVIINTKKGKELFEVSKKDLNYEKCTLGEARLRQPNLKNPTTPSKKRKLFFQLYKKIGFKGAYILGIKIPKVIFKTIRKIKNYK